MTTPHSSRDPEAQTEAPSRRRWLPNFAMAGQNDDVNDQTHDNKLEKLEEAAEYGDSSAMYWRLYTSEAKVSDQKLIDTLIGDTQSMSLLNGIYSSIIASFIIQTSQALQPNNGQETVCLLSQLASQGNSTQPSSPSCPNPSLGPSRAAIRSNNLLLISFYLAMTSVLGCALINQWCREYMQYAYPRVAPHKHGRVRTYLFHGLNRFYMKRFMYGIHALLHISVFLFFCGISDYLHDVYPSVGMISWYCVIITAAGYAVLSIFPLIIGDCPYQTALTPPLLFGTTLLLFFYRSIWKWLRYREKISLPRREERHFDRSHYLVEKANSKKQAAQLDPHAMEWLFTDNDFSDTDMDAFLEGLPGYIQSQLTDAKGLPKVLTAPHILRRIRGHLLTCTTARLSEQTRFKRVSACVDSLRVIFDRSAERPGNPGDKPVEGKQLLQEYMQSIILGLNTLCEPPKPHETMDLRPFCVRALAFQGFLTRCLEPLSSTSKFPGHFIPLYTFFSSQNNTSQTQLRETVLPLTDVSDEKAPPDDAPHEDKKLWRVVLHDGPLINLRLLAEAILSHNDVDPSSLSMCWETLNILRSGFKITRVDLEFDSSLTLFDEAHEKTRRRIGAEEPGFSVKPLLEILDAVAGGRRLSMVFEDDPKYHGKADLVFGKDRLRNPDIFRAFAKCLPVYVSKNPGKSMALMEGLVFYDYLWTSLQAHLLNTLQPNSFIPDTLRVFDMCCTVIDAAFVALEDSRIVDWRAPDFGSLAHYFELFVTDCFQGMFVERAIGFRVGLIKARFCNAVLAQFLNEFDDQRVVVFRSHWDVASIARVFYSLGVGNDEDVKFWQKYVDGGAIDADFMANIYTMLRTAARDGPLLNFCRLGHLGTMAVPFKGSGLKDTEFKKLLDLQQKMVDKSSLTLVSTSVWKNLGQLRDEVIYTCERNSDEDKANMKKLLEKIDAVYSQRPSYIREHSPSDQPPGSLSSGLIPGIDGLYYASTSTAVTEDLQDTSLVPIQEDDFGGMTSAPFDKSRSEFKNVYRTAYPFLPRQNEPSGAIDSPFSTSFLPTLFPLLESTHPTSPSTSSPPSTSSNHHPRRQNTPRALVYYPPKGDISASRSATLSTLLSPSTVFSSPSNTWLDSSSSNGVYLTTQTAPPEEIK